MFSVDLIRGDYTYRSITLVEQIFYVNYMFHFSVCDPIFTTDVRRSIDDLDQFITLSVHRAEHDVVRQRVARVRLLQLILVFVCDSVCRIS